MTKAGFRKTDWFLKVAIAVSVDLFNRSIGVVALLARIAGALGYARKQDVVRREIESASIICEPESDSPKGTDFGIERITDASKIKTGMA